MNEEKPFDVVWKVLLFMAAIANDGLEIFFDVLAATGFGIVGQAIMEPINLAMDMVFTSIFVAKVGFGTPAMIQILDDLLELVGIPGRTACVALAIYIANNPKSKLGQAALLAATVIAAPETGGLSLVGEGAEVAEVAEEAETTAQTVRNAKNTYDDVSSATSSRTTRQQGSYTDGGQSDDDQNDSEQTPLPPDIDVMASPEEGNPTENLQKNLLEAQPDYDAPAPKSNVVPPKKMEDITTLQKPQQNDRFKDAA